MDEAELLGIVEEIIRSEIKVLGDQPIELDTRLVEDLGMDSLDLVAVVLELQERYSLRIGEREIGDYHCVADIVATIKDQLSAHTAA